VQESEVRRTVSMSLSGCSTHNRLGKWHVKACSVLVEASGLLQKQVTSRAPGGVLESPTRRQREARKSSFGEVHGLGDRQGFQTRQCRLASHASNPGKDSWLSVLYRASRAMWVDGA
jgi:hypothetical protein